MEQYDIVFPLCLPSISYRSLQDQVHLYETSIIDPEPNLGGLLTALAPAAGRPCIRFDVCVVHVEFNANCAANCQNQGDWPLTSVSIGILRFPHCASNEWTA